MLCMNLDQHNRQQMTPLQTQRTDENLLLNKDKDSLLHSLQENRQKRQKDRDSALRIAAMLRGDVASVIATALANSAMEKSEIGVQTEYVEIREFQGVLERYADEDSESGSDSDSGDEFLDTARAALADKMEKAVAAAKVFEFGSSQFPLPPGLCSFSSLL